MLKLIHPDTSHLDNFYDKGRFILAWRFVMLFTVVFFTLALLFINVNIEAAMVYFIITMLSICMTVYIRKTKKFLLTYQVFSLSAPLLVTYTLNVMENSLHYADFIWIIAIVLVTYIGLGSRWGIIALLFHSCNILYFIFFNLNNNIYNLKPLDNLHLIGGGIELIFRFMLITYLFKFYLDLKNHSEEKLQTLNKELIEQNAIVVAKNQENITLVKEIHHRVKNNLQIVISLLRMQSQEVNNDETRRQFEGAINRIMTISLIHQKLYQEKQLSFIPFSNYFGDSIEEIKDIHPQEININYSFDQRLLEIGLKTVVPLGLLLNELMTNSYKHGFQGDSDQHINIIFSAAGNDSISLHYSDSGVWKQNANGSGFGMELIDLLTEQMEGKWSRENSNFKFHLRNLDLN